jgi:ABC-2 type transport system permease protein
MRGARQTWLVALRELRERSRSPAFRVSVVIMIAVVVAMLVVPAVLESNGTKDIGVTGPVPSELAATIQSQGRAVGTNVRIHDYASLSAGEQAVRDGKVSVLVVSGNRLEWPRTVDQNLQAVVTGAIQLVAVRERAAAAGISPSAMARLLTPVKVQNIALGSVTGRSPDDESATIVMIGILVLTIGIYGGLVLSGVVEEKSSRVVEVLLARMPARNLLAGKILGVGLLGLAQVVVTALVALVATAALGSLHLPAIRGSVLAWAVVWFVLGYALYATLYGALGALASRPEDAQSVAGPAMAIMVASYLASFLLVREPDSALSRALSFVPVTAPFSMPSRLAIGAVAWWEPLLAVVLALVGIAGLVVLGGRLYAGAILHGGPALGLRDAVQSCFGSPRDQKGRRHHEGALWRGASAITERRTAMGMEKAISTRTMAEIAVAGAGIGAGVGVPTGDVILGVIAGAGFIAIASWIARAWTSHTGHRVTHW